MADPTGRRIVFSVSDHTGVTAEAVAHSVMARFEGIDIAHMTRPFIDTSEKVGGLLAEIETAAAAGRRPIVFSTLSDGRIQEQLQSSSAVVLSLFDRSVAIVAAELGVEPSAGIGSYHGVADAARYQLRLDAVDYSLMTDDGLGVDHYGRADVILVGVSRVGKTPSCLYLSMQYGIRAANYPLAIDDHLTSSLPPTLGTFRERLYGLTIEPRRLHAIRMQRRPDSTYAQLDVCKQEVAWAEQLFRSERIPSIDTTARSIEEITATIIEDAGLARRAG